MLLLDGGEKAGRVPWVRAFDIGMMPSSCPDRCRGRCCEIMRLLGQLITSLIAGVSPCGF